MASSTSRIEQALIELLDAYAEIEAAVEEKTGADSEVFAQSIIEELEPALETVVEDSDLSTASIATLLSCLSDALEQIDPAAFESSGDEDEDEAYEYEEDEEYDDDDDLLDLDEEEEDDDE